MPQSRQLLSASDVHYQGVKQRTIYGARICKLVLYKHLRFRHQVTAIGTCCVFAAHLEHARQGCNVPVSLLGQQLLDGVKGKTLLQFCCHFAQYLEVTLCFADVVDEIACANNDLLQTRVFGQKSTRDNQPLSPQGKYWAESRALLQDF